MAKYARYLTISATGVGTLFGIYHFLPNNRKVAHAALLQQQLQTPRSQWDRNWDLREPSSLTKPTKNKQRVDNNNNNVVVVDGNETDEMKENLNKQKSKSSRHLILIRHGQYNMNTEIDSEKKLTELGREQAKYSGDRLNELNLPYTVINVSTMCRAAETASIIAERLNNKQIPMRSTDLLREGAPIPPEPPSRSWRPETHQFHTDGARIEAAFRKHFHRAPPDQTEDSYEIFVCHANVIRYCVCRALQFPPEGWLRMSLGHGSMTWLTIRPNGNVSLKVLGEVGHFPPSLITLQ